MRSIFVWQLKRWLLWLLMSVPFWVLVKPILACYWAEINFITIHFWGILSCFLIYHHITYRIFWCHIMSVTFSYLTLIIINRKRSKLLAIYLDLVLSYLKQFEACLSRTNADGWVSHDYLMRFYSSWIDTSNNLVCRSINDRNVIAIHITYVH